jgi:hypothetical protein
MASTMRGKADMHPTGFWTANGSRRYRVLLGAHAEVLRRILVDVLDTEKYQVIAVATGSELVDKLAVSLHPEYGSSKTDLVIVEAALFGKQELQRLGRLADWAGIPPLMLLTDPGDDHVVSQVRELVTVTTVEKPLELAHLRKLARGLVAVGADIWASPGKLASPGFEGMGSGSPLPAAPDRVTTRVPRLSSARPRREP